MKRLFQISRYPALFVFLLAGASTVVIAYSSYNLLSLSMANLHFLRKYGWLAVSEGGLLQFVEILAYAILALACFFVFKICETELLIRYRQWQDKP